MKFDILNRFTGAVQFTAEIECADTELASIKLGLAVRRAVKARADLTGADLTRVNLTGAYRCDGVPLTKPPIQIYGLKWPVTILDAHMQVGCELHSLAEWAEFNEARIAGMDGFASRKFWNSHRDTLLSIAKAEGRS